MIFHRQFLKHGLVHTQIRITVILLVLDMATRLIRENRSGKYSITAKAVEVWKVQQLEKNQQNKALDSNCILASTHADHFLWNSHTKNHLYKYVIQNQR